MGVRLDFTSVFRALHIVRSRAQTALASVEIVEQQGHTTFLSYSWSDIFGKLGQMVEDLLVLVNFYSYLAIAFLVRVLLVLLSGGYSLQSAGLVNLLVTQWGVWHLLRLRHVIFVFTFDHIKLLVYFRGSDLLLGIARLTIVLVWIRKLRVVQCKNQNWVLVLWFFLLGKGRLVVEKVIGFVFFILVRTEILVPLLEFQILKGSFEIRNLFALILVPLNLYRLSRLH